MGVWNFMAGTLTKKDSAALLAKEKSDFIDKKITEESISFKREVKVLLLGTPESGLGTLVKRMKIVHSGFSDAEREEYRPVIYQNVLDSAQQLVTYIKKAGLEGMEYSNMTLIEKVLHFRLDITNTVPIFSLEIAEVIHKLWRATIMPEIMDTDSLVLYPVDSAAYFLGEILRIGTPAYLPNDTDILRAKEKRKGIIETKFSMGQLSVFCPRANCYSCKNTSARCWEPTIRKEEVLPEEQTHTALLESLVLFESVVNSKWFLRTSIILFFNKIDAFKKKIPKYPLEKYFQEYTSGPDANKAAKYILWKFMQTNRARLSVFPHVTNETDPTNIRLVFAAVKETIIQNMIDDSSRSCLGTVCCL